MIFYVSKTFHVDESPHACVLLMALLATQSPPDLLFWFVLPFNDQSIRWTLRNFVPIYTNCTLVFVLLRLIFIRHDEMVWDSYLSNQFLHMRLLKWVASWAAELVDGKFYAIKHEGFLSLVGVFYLRSGWPYTIKN